MAGHHSVGRACIIIMLLLPRGRGCICGSLVACIIIMLLAGVC
jgi:hypothetical protein